MIASLSCTSVELMSETSDSFTNVFSPSSSSTSTPHLTSTSTTTNGIITCCKSISYISLIFNLCLSRAVIFIVQIREVFVRRNRVIRFCRIHDCVQLLCIPREAAPKNKVEVRYSSSNSNLFKLTSLSLLFSQVLVLPPFQRMGHGAEMLQTFYNLVIPQKSVLDVTGQ